MNKQAYPGVAVNGRHYLWPRQPLVVVCIDGSEPDYIEAAVADGVMPWTKRTLARGASDLRGNCVMPSFTNPNNMSIVTGVPPVEHGICGNFFYDMENDAAVMMNEPSLLRCPTIFKAFQDAGAKVAIITAKDKLRRLLGHGLDMHKDWQSGGAICFSSEKSAHATPAENGIEPINESISMATPGVYSAELSEFIFKAGVALMQSHRPDIMYLSTTDYIQHKCAPGSDGANAFYAMMDSYWAQFDGLGAMLAFTADHGMNAKHLPCGTPNVIYLQDLADQWLSANAAKVILPITDPYVVHHGALGSFATIYAVDSAAQEALLRHLSGHDGIAWAGGKTDACAKFQLPADRMGDLVVVGDKHTVLGTRASEHDLSGLDVPLRSHGGISEQRVPLMFNRKIEVDESISLNNFDIFDLALNHQTDFTNHE